MEPVLSVRRCGSLSYGVVGLAAAVLVSMTPSDVFADGHGSTAPTGASPSSSPPPPGPASGQTVVEEGPSDSKWRLEGQLGLGMPLGGAGLEVTSFVARGLSISGGVGKSIEGPIQIGLMPRLSVIKLFDSIEFTVGVGVSYGDYEQADFLWVDNGGFYPNTLWGNIEVSFSITLGGVGLRGFSGYSSILSHGTDDSRSEPSATEIPYLGLGLGYTL